MATSAQYQKLLDSWIDRQQKLLDQLAADPELQPEGGQAPSFTAPGGLEISWTEYNKMICEAIDKYDKLLQAALKREASSKSKSAITQAIPQSRCHPSALDFRYGTDYGRRLGGFPGI